MAAVLPPASQAHSFLFADLRDYSRFADTQGDRAAAELLAAYRVLVRQEVERHSGAEIRTEGDSFYVVFPSASAAIRCALSILAAARAASEHDPARPIHVGIGIHAGETAETAEGLVGSAVNIAARVCAQATAGELLVTDIVRGLTRTALPYGFVPVGTRRLKGIAEPIALYRVVPEGTVVAPRRGLAIPGLAGRIASRIAGPVLAGLIVVVIVVAGLLGAAALGIPGGAQPSPTNAATTSPTPESSLAEAAFPNSAENDLLSRLPLTVYDSSNGQTNCTRSGPTDAAPGATVSIRCDLPITADATFVLFDQFPGASAMGAFASSLLNRYHLLKGSCSTQAAAWQLWQLPTVFSGQLLCYPDETGHSWDSWTYDGLFILARATRDDDNWQKLYLWQKLTAPLMLH